MSTNEDADGQDRARAPKHYTAPTDTVLCLRCGSPTEQHPDGRSKLYCSDKCRAAAYRARRRGASRESDSPSPR